MTNTKHKVFISYHHANDQLYKEELLRLNKLHDIFIDSSVDTGDIDENLNDNRIREVIRDEYLKDSSVTILLVGAYSDESEPPIRQSEPVKSGGFLGG